MTELQADNHHEPAWLTIERTIYLAIILIALVVRFYEIGSSPLHALEARNAWPAWFAATGSEGEGNSTVAGSALLYSLHVGFFSLFGDSDTIARLAPAVLGVLMALLPWWWRRFVGRTVALFLSLLVAIDPWLVYFSRLADGAMVSTFCAMLVLTCFINLVLIADGESVNGPANGEKHQAKSVQHRYKWSAIAAVGLGLLLVSGIMAWSYLVLLAVFFVIYRRTLQETIVRRMSLLAWFGGAAVLGATAWAARFEGLRFVSTSLDAWMDGFWPGGILGSARAIDNAYAVSWLHLATDQPFITVFGIGGLVYLAIRAHNTASDEDSRWFRFLVIWLLWGVLQLLWPGRGAFGLIVLAGPLMIGAAHALGELTRLIPPKEHWHEVGGTAVALTGLLVAIAFWLAALVFNRQFSPDAVQPVLILVVLVLLVFLAYGFWSSWKEAFWLAGTFVASILFLLTISKISHFSFQASAERAPRILQEETHQDILRLVTDVETLSAQRTGDPHAMPLQIQMARPMLGVRRTEPMIAEPDPLLGWHFRNMNRLEWTLTPSADGSTPPGPAIVSVGRMDNGESDSATSRDLPAGYIGSTYVIRSYWQPADLRRDAPGAEISPEAGLWAKITAGLSNQWERQIQPALRWMLYGEVTEMPTMQSVVLWVAGEP